MRGVKDIIGSMKKTGRRGMRGMKTLGSAMKRMAGTISHATGSGRGLHRTISRKLRMGR